jgi:hypothetical protein
MLGVGLDGTRRIDWMSKWIIKAHPTQDRMASQASTTEGGIAQPAVPRRAADRDAEQQPADADRAVLGGACVH